MTDRGALIDAFLDAHGWRHAERRPLPADASFRRYVRMIGADGRTAMLMDAPPPREDVRPFVAVDRELRGRGFSAPDILAADEDSGLLLLEDLGDATFTRVLAAGGDEEALYRLAVDVLIELHRRPPPAGAPIPPYDDDRMLAEAALFVDWYLPAVSGVPLSADARAHYLDLWRRALIVARRVPQTLVLRDFHVDNLMLVDGRRGLAACGLLDFQDAVIGPASYDLVSLVEDARRDIVPDVAGRMTRRYLDAFPALDRDAFASSMAVLAAQRHAKVIGIFTRLDRRDGKSIYLHHIPRVWRLLERSLEHPALEPLRDWIQAALPPERRLVPLGRPS